MSLHLIQTELKAPKNQKNTFGNYTYRSCEDILEAVKPLIKKYGGTITCSDEIVVLGERYYIKATATYSDKENNQTSVSAFAREPLTKPKFDESQITGSASSYARKYALNGLFAIDDTKDADFTNIEEDEKKPAYQPKKVNIATMQVIEGLINQTSSDIASVCKFYKVGSLSEMTPVVAQEAIKMLQKKLNKINNEENHMRQGEPQWLTYLILRKNTRS